MQPFGAGQSGGGRFGILADDSGIDGTLRLVFGLVVAFVDQLGAWLNDWFGNL